MALAVPRRVILRLNEEYIQEHATIIHKFFELHHDQSTDDFFVHLRPEYTPPKMYIVLDLYCQQYPTVDISQMQYEVFNVKKADDLYVIVLRLLANGN